MSALPIFLNPDQQTVLIIGATAAAMSKLALIAETGAAIHLVGNGVEEALFAAGHQDLDAIKSVRDRAFDTGDLEGISLVYASTDDDAEERAIAKLAKKHNIPVNIVDRPALGTFITPAQFRRGPISVAYSTGGKAPVFTRRLRALLEQLLPPALGRLAGAAGSLRSELKDIIPDSTTRRQFWDRLFDTADRFQDLSEDETRDAIIDTAKAHDQTSTGLVQLVGAGPGDPDLLTIRAHRALQQADVVLYDRLVSREVLSLARRDAKMVFVGKQEGNHGVGQDGIARLMLKNAREGKRVVRLKQGDPLLFARAGEELDALRDANIPLEVVPGISAIGGIAAVTQIPLTDRRWSTSLTLVTGHTKDGDFTDWARLAGQGQTLVIYMGLKKSPVIAENLIRRGVSATTPVAIIQNGTMPDERRFYTTLAAMPQTIKQNQIKSPALLMIGDVVQEAKDWPVERFATLETALAG